MSAKTSLRANLGFGSRFRQIYPNLIKDVEIEGLDQVWISDITYVRLPATFCYLAAILDAYSRKSTPASVWAGISRER